MLSTVQDHAIEGALCLFYICKRKGRDLTQPYDRSPYTDRKTILPGFAFILFKFVNVQINIAIYMHILSLIWFIGFTSKSMILQFYDGT